jgi:protein tyrosine phosphatase (PTP) superfamily phosphohydrolase (DUF442 family)
MDRSIAARRAAAIAAAVLLTAFAFSSCYFRTSSPAVPRPASWAERIPSKHLKNLYKLDEGVFRSEQPSRAGFEELRDLGIRTVLNLRSSHSDNDEAAGSGLVLVRVPMTAGRFTEADIVAALRAIKDAAKPVLIHCQAGADRSGVVSAMYRVVFQGWSKEEAVAELLGGGFGFHSRYKNIPEFIRGANVDKIRKRLGPEAFPARSDRRPGFFGRDPGADPVRERGRPILPAGRAENGLRGDHRLVRPEAGPDHGLGRDLSAADELLDEVEPAVVVAGERGPEEEAAEWGEAPPVADAPPGHDKIPALPMG